MLTTSGNIGSLVNWFKESRFKYLCLLVTGHLDDYELFSSIFDKRAILDNVSGDKIAVFLFSNKLDELFSVELLKQSRYGFEKFRAILSGTQLNSSNEIREFPDILSVDNLTKDLKDDIVMQSQLVSDEICKYFNIPFSDIPCILLLERGEDETIIIPTKGELDVKSFFEFLKDLRILSEKMPELNNIKEDIDRTNQYYDANSTLEYSVDRISKFDFEIFDLKNNYNIYIDEATSILSSNNISKEVTSQLFSEKNSLSIKTILLNNGANTEISKESTEKIAKILYSNPELREIITKIQYSASKVLNLEDEKRRFETRKSNTEKRMIDLSPVLEDEIQRKMQIELTKIKSVRDDMERLEKKYERLFWRRHQIRPIKVFMEGFLGFTKATKEILSLEESLLKLVKK